MYMSQTVWKTKSIQKHLNCYSQSLMWNIHDMCNTSTFSFVKLFWKLLPHFHQKIKFVCCPMYYTNAGIQKMATQNTKRLYLVAIQVKVKLPILQQITTNMGSPIYILQQMLEFLILNMCKLRNKPRSLKDNSVKDQWITFKPKVIATV